MSLTAGKSSVSPTETDANKICPHVPPCPWSNLKACPRDTGKADCRVKGTSIMVLDTYIHGPQFRDELGFKTLVPE